MKKLSLILKVITTIMKLPKIIKDYLPMKVDFEVLTEPTDIVMKQIDNPDTDKYDGEWYQVLSEVKYIYDGEEGTIPPGMVTDFGSVPRFGRGIVPKLGRGIVAYVVHDRFYSNDSNTPKHETDSIMYHLMRRSGGMRKVRAMLAYLAVTLAGDKFFHRYKTMFYEVGYFNNNEESE